MITAFEARNMSDVADTDRKRMAEEARVAAEKEQIRKIRDTFFTLVSRVEMMVILKIRSSNERRVVLDFIPIYDCSEVTDPLDAPKPYDELAKKFSDVGYKISFVSSEAITDPAFPMYFVLEW